MVRGRTVAAFAMLGLAACPLVARAEPDCADIVPATTAGPQDLRALVPEDLARLRDIGPADPTQRSDGLFSISPDGRRAAFQLRRADPAANAYCLAMVVVDLNAKKEPLVVDRGGDFIRRPVEFRGMANFPSGVADPITPRWSPDGRWILFRRRDGGAVQLWRAQADGSGSSPLTASQDDIDDFRISSDGRTIIYSTRPGLRAALASIEAEGRSGFRYDERFSPASSSRPFPRAPLERSVWALDLAGLASRPATEAEAALLYRPTMREGSWTSSAGTGGAIARIVGASGDAAPTLGRLAVERSGRRIQCDAAECADASSPWWEGDAIRFMRREGHARRVTAIYEWQPGSRVARRLYATEDVMLNCVPERSGLVCLREASRQPRRLERIELADGRRTVIFDPNPEFASLRLGAVERLWSTNRFGLDAFADLVLPTAYEPGRRYPLIVVQYRSRGFLRGGTGDEYPIQAFANRGYAVLSVDRPRPVGSGDGTRALDIDKGNIQGFGDRRSVLDTVEGLVRVVIERGIADPDRIGITGLSDGSATAAFALLHSNLFSAFAMSSCCPDTSLPVRVGPGAAKQFHYMGYPALTDDGAAAKAFWREIAITPNAAAIRAPILAQVSDDEHWGALQSFIALREQGRPIDLYIFPGEHHVKWQPAHRLAVYKRSLDWFDYWFKGERASGRAEDIAHWDRLKRELEKQSDVAGSSRPHDGRGDP